MLLIQTLLKLSSSIGGLVNEAFISLELLALAGIIRSTEFIPEANPATFFVAQGYPVPIIEQGHQLLVCSIQPLILISMFRIHAVADARGSTGGVFKTLIE